MAAVWAPSGGAGRPAPPAFLPPPPTWTPPRPAPAVPRRRPPLSAPTCGASPPSPHPPSRHLPWLPPRPPGTPPPLLLAPMEVLGDVRFRTALAGVGGVEEMITEFIRIPDPPPGHPYTRRAMRGLLGRKYPPRGQSALRVRGQGGGGGGGGGGIWGAGSAGGGGLVLPAAVAGAGAPLIGGGGGGGAGPGEALLAPQIMGGDPAALALAVEVLVEEHGAHRVDLNAGCPSKRVTSRGAGSSLLTAPAALAEALAAMVATSPSLPGGWGAGGGTAAAAGGAVPITVKLRSGYDCTTSFDTLIDAVTGAGVAALALHPRTKAQAYTGRADWGLIARARTLTPLPVVGNGDVRGGGDGAALVAATGADAVMVGRGAVADPWVFGDIWAALGGGGGGGRGAPRCWASEESFWRTYYAAHVRGGGRRGDRDHLSALKMLVSTLPAARWFGPGAPTMGWKKGGRRAGGWGSHPAAHSGHRPVPGNLLRPPLQAPPIQPLTRRVGAVRGPFSFCRPRFVHRPIP